MDHNIGVVTRLIRQAAKDGASFIATVEYFSGLTTKDGLFLPVAFPEANNPVLKAFSGLAKELKIWLLLGSLDIKRDDCLLYTSPSPRDRG